MTALTEPRLEVRRAETADQPEVLKLLTAALGWSSDERSGAFFAWKHEHNPFGPSAAWVAIDDGAVVGFRTFMRWEHRTAGGDVISAVRAVDAATHPDHQRRGIFRRLTLQALDNLQAEGTALVFNTPNDKSRAGNLTMGWSVVGRLPAAVRVTSPPSLVRTARARVPADRWSSPATAGRAASDVLADPGLPDLLAAAGARRGLHTNRTPAYLRWRYGFAPLAYRAITLDDDLRGGLAVFRLRRRGAALECALCEVIVPGGDPTAERALVRSVTRACAADYVIRLGAPVLDRAGFARVPRQGPVLTWHGLAPGVPGRRLDDWDLALGDVELF